MMSPFQPPNSSTIVFLVLASLLILSSFSDAGQTISSSIDRIQERKHYAKKRPMIQGERALPITTRRSSKKSRLSQRGTWRQGL